MRSEVQASRPTRTEAWREPEPPGADQPDAAWAPAGRPAPAAGPDAGALQLRSDLARHLDRATFPADRQHLLGTLTGHQAPPQLIDLVSELGDGQFSGLAAVVRAVGLPLESRYAAE
ncbi:MAG TPA: DUF2795 domain-containing protein [Streptosporangiaceae bacterium]|nr:DUF2795 domain-containing protein [Streptosporangiaceae bacterium]